jgi:hypothetical protein
LIFPWSSKEHAPFGRLCRLGPTATLATTARSLEFQSCTSSFFDAHPLTRSFRSWFQDNTTDAESPVHKHSFKSTKTLLRISRFCSTISSRFQPSPVTHFSAKALPTWSCIPTICAFQTISLSKHGRKVIARLGFVPDPNFRCFQGPAVTPEHLWICPNIQFTVSCSFQDFCESLDLDTARHWMTVFHHLSMFLRPRRTLMRFSHLLSRYPSRIDYSGCNFALPVHVNFHICSPTAKAPAYLWTFRDSENLSSVKFFGWYLHIMDLWKSYVDGAEIPLRLRSKCFS